MDTEKNVRKHYDKEFKLNAVKLSIDTKRSTASIARDLGIDAHTLYSWVREYRDDAEQAFPGKGNLRPEDEEHRQLKKRVADLEEENAILKKAMGYFSAIKK